MVVGVGGAVLVPAEGVYASEVALRVGARSCTVAGGTPLAVLDAIRRAGGSGFALRDYGHCGSSAASSAQLFVLSINGETNSGQSGWEYKVGGAAGGTGAADPSGPQGNGRRLSPAARVLWFWCVASARGCQRTLEVSASTTTVARGGSVSVAVTGYDNEGRGVPVAGAQVQLGSKLATTGSHGRATVTAPGTPGRYALSASRRGLVPAFPGTIVVR
jgi:hypothetical protein